MSQSNKYTRYHHHNPRLTVVVRKDLKGRHREFCLCWSCKYFHPDEEDNCFAAKKLFAICCAYDMVTPVFECPVFKERADDKPE